ncbi:hypothetical protein ACGFX2_20670 [Streptomyces goshikiensis]|uniref:hypothetical protein n=1 Tax=Streptomyces goshikiensis TaxID=1942 RepID=UPI00371926BE
MNDRTADEATRSTAPLWSTVTAILLGPIALLLGGLAPMAGDACAAQGCSPALAVISGSLLATCAATPVLLLAAWLLPNHRRFDKARRATAWSALLPPLSVILLTLGLPL